MRTIVYITLLCTTLATTMSIDFLDCGLWCGLSMRTASNSLHAIKVRCHCAPKTDSPPTTTTAQPVIVTQKAHTEKPTTARAETSTTICDYLCSVQMGGDACNCGHPSLPGK